MRGSSGCTFRAPAGTRIEATERLFSEVEGAIRKTIPADQLDLTLDNIGLPVGGVNFAYSTTGSIGPSDGEILVTLKEGKHGPTADIIEELRRTLPQQFPELTFFFQPADITSQILNFGLPAPIDIQVTGRDPGNFALAEKIAARVRRIPGAADTHIHQVVDMPELRVNVNRERAQAFGMTQRDVANNLLISLASSGQTFPNYWLDPKKRRQLSGCCADAAVPAQQHGHIAKHVCNRKRWPDAPIVEQSGGASTAQNQRSYQPLQCAAHL